MQIDLAVQPSLFDFDIPDWMFPPIPCPAFSNEETSPTIQEQKLFLVKRVFRVEEWLAAKGYNRSPKTGYLGLSFDVKAGTVRREGFPFLVRLGKKLARLFIGLLSAGPSGLEDYMLDEAYPSTPVARRQAKKELQKKLSHLGITVAKKRWVLECMIPSR
jgi:hypothetical protein